MDKTVPRYKYVVYYYYFFYAEYLLGDSILVAPVLEEGAVTRDIYLPAGSWKDEVAGDLNIIHTGPLWLVGYEADLWTLPYFTKQ